MKNFKIKMISCLVLLGIFHSCDDDFLDRQPLNIISESDVWSSLTGVEAYLVTLYNNMQTEDFNYNGIIDYQGYLPYVTDICLRAKTWGTVSNVSIMPSNAYGWWGYGQVRQANLFLENIDDASISQDQKVILRGEARFIRAFYYFSMVKRYGGVPIIEDAQQFTGDNLAELQVSRNTEQEVYDWIASELDLAIADLPATRGSDDKFRATKWAAYALKSRAMLYAASSARYAGVQLNGLIGIPSSEAERYYTAAKNASKAIMDSEQYTLFDESDDKAQNFYDLFMGDGTNSEMIFVKSFKAPDKTHSFDFFNTPHSFRIDWGSGFNPTVDLVQDYEYVDGSEGTLRVNDANGNPIKYQNPADLFDGKDPRFFATVLYPFAPYQGGIVEVRAGIIDNDQIITAGNLTDLYGQGSEAVTIMGKDGPSANSDPTKTGFYLHKFINDSQQVPDGRSETPWPIFRYAEVLLNYAEATVELGENGLALDAINRIRTRAGIASLENIDRDKVRHERKVELAFENHRFWDLRRWRNGTEILNNTQPLALNPYLVWEDKTYIFSIDNAPRQPRTWTEQMYWEAIPGNEISTNPNMIQNPLY